MEQVMAFPDLPQAAQDRITAAWLETHRIMFREGPSHGPEAGCKHYFSAVAKELWNFLKPDVDGYKTRLEQVGEVLLKQFEGIGNGVHPVVVGLLVMKWQAKALRERAGESSATRSGGEDRDSALRRGYRAEIRAYMEKKEITTIPQAAKALGVGPDTLKSIMSDKGKKRYSNETLEEVLKKVGNVLHTKHRKHPRDCA